MKREKATHTSQRNSNQRLASLGRVTEQTKGDFGAYREEAGSVARFGQIP